jgi:hypothetical protein
MTNILQVIKDDSESHGIVNSVTNLISNIESLISKNGGKKQTTINKTVKAVNNRDNDDDDPADEMDLEKDTTTLNKDKSKKKKNKSKKKKK